MLRSFLIFGITICLSFGIADVVYLNIWLLPKVFQKEVKNTDVHKELQTPETVLMSDTLLKEKEIIIHYAPGRSALTENMTDTLLKYLEEFSILSNCGATIVGHADMTGDSVRNIQLSRNRAKKMTNFLIAQGFQEKNIITRWYGSSQPLVQGRSIEAFEKNRRTMINISRVIP